MTDLKSIISTIEKYYPLLENFDESKILNNKYLIELGNVCERAKLELPNWNQKLQRLDLLLPDSQITDYTLLEANDPCFMVSVFNPIKKTRVACYVSIICPYFSSFIQSEESEDVHKLNSLIINWLQEEFPDYQYLPEQECRTELSWIAVPSYNGYTVTTIADCIFSTRSLKGH